MEPLDQALLKTGNQWEHSKCAQTAGTGRHGDISGFTGARIANVGVISAIDVLAQMAETAVRIVIPSGLRRTLGWSDLDSVGELFLVCWRRVKYG